MTQEHPILQELLDVTTHTYSTHGQIRGVEKVLKRYGTLSSPEMGLIWLPRGRGTKRIYRNAVEGGDLHVTTASGDAPLFALVASRAVVEPLRVGVQPRRRKGAS